MTTKNLAAIAAIPGVILSADPTAHAGGPTPTASAMAGAAPETIESAADEAQIEARIRVLTVGYDIDHWIQRATLSGPLAYYDNDPSNHRQIAKYLIQLQRVGDPEAPEIDYRAGGWSGDNYLTETFDEGGHGRAMLVLSSILDRYGNIWSFNHASGGTRDVRMALESAIECALLNQFQGKHHDFPNNLGWYGIPGPWPQSPGWRTGEAKFPEIAGLRTYNDFATSDTLLGLVGARPFFPEYAALIDEAAVLCGDGTHLIQARNHGGLPEQCDAWGVPVWGRGHEPPSVAPRATATALHIYMAAHAVTGDPKWLVYTLETRDWLLQTDVGGGFWEHFLEPATTAPGDWAPIWGDNRFNVVTVREEAYWPAAVFGSLVTSPYTAIGQANRYFDAIECSADLDGDADTDVYDFGTFLGAFGSEGTGLAGDYDGDGDVDVLDFAALASEFGCSP